jgi:hypothetical protein
MVVLDLCISYTHLLPKLPNNAKAKTPPKRLYLLPSSSQNIFTIRSQIKNNGITIINHEHFLDKIKKCSREDNSKIQMISSREDKGRNKHIKMSNKQIGKITLSCNV